MQIERTPGYQTRVKFFACNSHQGLQSEVTEFLQKLPKDNEVLGIDTNISTSGVGEHGFRQVYFASVVYW